MSRSSILAFLLAFGFIAQAQRPIDVTHYRYEISLNDTNDSIHCAAYISFIATQPSATVVFDLAGINKKQKGMSVTNVNLLKENKPTANFTHTNDKLTITAAQTFQKGDTATVLIVYKGIPSDGLIISKNKYGHRTFFADNWPDRGHNWLACVDDPADKASLEFIVKAPDHYQVVANGIQEEETSLPGNFKLTHWKEDVPVPTKVMVIGVADFAVNLSGMVNDCIPVSSWVYPEDRGKGFYDYAQAAEILPFFINYVGPYGYKKLANVQSKTTFGGLENANTIFYYENSITGTRKSESLIAHEIAHQWFGNMATEKSFAHLWLSEGFATYMTILYMENKYGADTARKMLAEDRQQVIEFVKENNTPVIDTSSDYMKLLNANNYQKGGWILHMLRRQLGDSIFRKSIRAYYSTYAGKNADTKDLQTIFEKISGKDLSGFFQQWLYTPGIPKLDIQWKYRAAEKKLELTITQSQAVAFSFPLELQINTGSAKEPRQTVQVNKQKQVFTISCDRKPVKIIPDPATSLLFSATLTEVL